MALTEIFSPPRPEVAFGAPLLTFATRGMGEEGVIASDKRANLFKQTYLIIAVIRTFTAIIVVLLIVAVVIFIVAVVTAQMPPESDSTGEIQRGNSALLPEFP